MIRISDPAQTRISAYTAVLVVKALMNAEEKRKEEPKSDKFEQPDEPFITDFMDALIEKIENEQVTFKIGKTRIIKDVGT